jgi:hypothetical protein
MLLLGVISKIKQNSSDMNEIILVPCDAGYVQNCTGFVQNGPLCLIPHLYAMLNMDITEYNYKSYFSRSGFLYRSMSYEL